MGKDSWPWNDEKHKLLKELRWEGVTFKEIGVRLFKTERARCAVAGRCDRLGYAVNPEVLAARQAQLDANAWKREAERKQRVRNLFEKRMQSKVANAKAAAERKASKPKPFQSVNVLSLLAPRKQASFRDITHIPTPGFYCSFLEADADQCRFPVGNPEQRDNFRFCGKPVIKGQSYCKECYSVCYMPVPARGV